MKKVLKSILKWLVCVLLTFSILFTIIMSSSSGLNLISAVDFEINEEEYLEFLHNDDEFLSAAKNMEELASVEIDDENPKSAYEKAMTEYPIGTRILMEQYFMERAFSNINITSMLLGLIIGTLLYCCIENKCMKGKLLIILYIFSLVALGFVEGIGKIVEGGTILDKWEFPKSYIIPVTAVFALIYIIKIAKQKDIANKLNEKLKERKGNNH